MRYSSPTKIECSNTALNARASFVPHLLHIFLICLFFNSCVRDKDIFIPNQTLSIIPLNDQEALGAFFGEIEPETSIFQFSSQNSGRISIGNILVDIPADAFLGEDGNPINDTFAIELSDLSDTKGLLSQNMTLDQGDAYISNLGAFGFNASNNGEAVSLAEDQSIGVLIPFEGVSDPNIGVYELLEDSSSSKVWIPLQLPISITEYLDESTENWKLAYYFQVDHLGKFVCGLEMSSEENVTNLCISLPEGYTSNNTRVYLALEDQKTLIGLDWQGGYFCDERVPIDVSGDLLVIAVSGDETYRAATEFIQTSPGFQLKNLEPIPYDLNEILELIDNF